MAEYWKINAIRSFALLFIEKLTIFILCIIYVQEAIII